MLPRKEGWFNRSMRLYEYGARYTDIFRGRKSPVIYADTLAGGVPARGDSAVLYVACVLEYVTVAAGVLLTLAGMSLVILLHGIGGDEHQLVPYTNLKVPARLVYVRGLVANGTAPNAGHRYFKARFTAAGFMADVEAMAAQIVRVTDTIASQRAVTRTLVLGYSQGGHVAWLLAATGRYDVVLPVSGALAPSYQPPPPAGTTTIRAMHGEDGRTLPATAGAGCGDLPGLLGRRLQGRLLAGAGRPRAGHTRDPRPSGGRSASSWKGCTTRLAREHGR